MYAAGGAVVVAEVFHWHPAGELGQKVVPQLLNCSDCPALPANLAFVKRWDVMLPTEVEPNERKQLHCQSILLLDLDTALLCTTGVQASHEQRNSNSNNISTAECCYRV
jgi:hypothetical protein